MAGRSVSIDAAGTSDWLNLPLQVIHRLDIDVPATVTAISYTLETTVDTDGRPKTIKKPNDVDTDWTMSESMALRIEGQCSVRLNITTFTGSGSVVLSTVEARTTN